MTDHRLVPPDDELGTTQPSRQGEVPDWFTTSEESEPMIIKPPVPPEEDIPVKLPTVEELAAAESAQSAEPAATAGNEPPAESDDEADSDTPLPDDAAELDEEDYDEDDDVEAYTDAQTAPPPLPVGTRRRPVRQPAYPVAPPPGRGYGCADVITAIFLLLTILSVSITILLLANPRSPLNPLPYPTFPPVLVLASPLPTDTPTYTPTPEPPTPTPLATYTFTPTATYTPTATPTVTNTPVVGGASAAAASPTQGLAAVTAGPTLPPYTQSPFPFTTKPIRYQANTTKDGCQWQSIAGTVVDLEGKPIKGLAIRVAGSNGNIDEVHYSGTESRFGDSGFEVFLGPVPREDRYTVQLLGRTGAPISDTITVDTRSSCNENVAVIGFVQNHAY
ncbi:MAG: hypothetical protein IT324_17630 [Anaerolineae bacterium]|nr:hypothetical protein [Anaerolineae bacterium]